MFFFTYLARELRRRLRQAIFIALGLAIGVGLVVTVTGRVTSIGGVKPGDQVSARLTGTGGKLTVTAIQDPASLP